jgi:hypothetical protein
MSQPTSVSLSLGIDDQGNPLFILTLQEDHWQINVWMTEDELAQVPNIKTAYWSERGCIRLGECAGSPIFWSCEKGKLSILVGADDETWDFGLTLPESIIDEVIAEIERETKPQKQVDD